MKKVVNKAPNVESMYVKRLKNGSLKVYFSNGPRVTTGGSRIASLVLNPEQEKLFLDAIASGKETNITSAQLKKAA